MTPTIKAIAKVIVKAIASAAARAAAPLLFVLLAIGLLSAHPSAAGQTGPVFTFDRGRGYLSSNSTINQAVNISLTRSGSVIESATKPSPFSSYQFTTLLQPGDQITVQAGAVVLYDVVIIPINLVVDMANGQVSGKAFPGQLVEIAFYSRVARSTDTFNKCWDKEGTYPYNVTLQTTAAEDGYFTFTYSVGLRPGDMGSLTLYDAAGNKQTQTFNTGDTIGLNIQRRSLEAQFFPSIPNLTSVNVTIHDPEGALLWSTSVAYYTLYNAQFSLEIPQSVPLLPGEIIKVTDGVKTKQMIIPKITLDHLLGSQAVTGRVEIPGSDAAPSGYLVTGWYEFELIGQVDHCQEGPVEQGVISVSFGGEAFGALDEIYLTYEDGNGNFFANGVVVNSLILTKDRPEPVSGVFGVSLELQKTAFDLYHYRAGQVIGSYSGVTDTWGNNQIQTGSEVTAQAGDRVVVSAGGETLIDLIIPQLSAVVDPLQGLVTGLVTSQDPNPVPLMAYLQRVNGLKQDVYKTVKLNSNVDGSFSIQPLPGENWETPSGLPARPFKIDACTQVSTLYSQAPGGHVITWHGPMPANVSADVYEPDGAAQLAQPYTGPQRHTLMTGSDEDWISFEVTPANAGKQLVLSVEDLGWNMEVYLYLYKGNELLTRTTFRDTSKIPLTNFFTTPGIYTAQIKPSTDTNYNFGACDSAYTFSIQSPEPLRSSTHPRLSGSLPAPIYPGQAVTLHFDLAPGLPFGTLPGGTLTIRDGAATIEPVCEAKVTGASVDCTLTFSTPGRRSLTVSYSGDSLYEPSTLTGIIVTVSPFSTSTELSVSPQQPEAGQPVVLTARVSAQNASSLTPGGTVSFYDGKTALGGPVKLVEGAARLALDGLAAGTHTLIAVFSGEGNFSGSTAPPMELTVKAKEYYVFLPGVMR